MKSEGFIKHISLLEKVLDHSCTEFLLKRDNKDLQRYSIELRDRRSIYNLDVPASDTGHDNSLKATGEIEH